MQWQEKVLTSKVALALGIWGHGAHPGRRQVVLKPFSPRGHGYWGKRGKWGVFFPVLWKWRVISRFLRIFHSGFRTFFRSFPWISVNLYQDQVINSHGMLLCLTCTQCGEV